MLAAESVVDVWNDGNCDDGSDAESCADEAEESTVWVVEVYDPSISTIRMYLEWNVPTIEPWLYGLQAVHD